MSRVNSYYSVTPKIVPSHKCSTITIRPLDDHCRFKPDVEYKLSCIPAAGFQHQTRWGKPIPANFTIEMGDLIFDYDFEKEQEYVVILEGVKDEKSIYEVEFRLYALDEDLYTRRPYKGDTHMHTLYSDGTESPAYVASRCREIGLDFMAITDHHKLPPSLEAIEKLTAMDTDLRVFPGEEVHPPEVPVHMVNFGGSFSVNALFNTPEYEEEVRKIMDSLTDIPSGVDTYTYASCVYCFNKIREAGGLGIFCHPYWFVFHRYDVPEYLTDLLFEREPFDAVEIIGGFGKGAVESNTLAVARYQEERAKGKKIPVVGASDAHCSTESALFGWYNSIVFAPSSDLTEIIGSIKDLYSVAMEAVPDESVRTYGPFRLVKFSQYLIREVFPNHDKLCRAEGELMLAIVAGDESALERLKLTKGAVKRFYDSLWKCTAK